MGENHQLQYNMRSTSSKVKQKLLCRALGALLLDENTKGEGRSRVKNTALSGCFLHKVSSVKIAFDC
jgi:hypothetical protein